MRSLIEWRLGRGLPHEIQIPDYYATIPGHEVYIQDFCAQVSQNFEVGWFSLSSRTTDQLGLQIST